MWEVAKYVIGIYFIIGVVIGVLVVKMSNVIGKPTLRDWGDRLLRILFVAVFWIILLPLYIKYELLD